ncbi:hypothetical protein AB0H77_13000 [Streptomyces sp. NPDC050844]|uniref:hypothetical protein n=1 Tax=Streptomyces sp. NPDC050844 TaxID=3155790 RepID=UPI0033C7928D
MTPAELLDRQKLVDELQRLADHPSLTPRSAELGVLAKDLRPPHQLDRWAEVDLVDAYVRPESVVTKPPGSGRRDGLLEAALGVLVFIPLLVTWFGLREAVRAYGELSEVDREESTRPFLQLWQSGFGGHLSGFGRFENVALMAVLLIALLVGLSVWHARVRSRAEQEEAEQQRERDRLLAELASVLTRTQMLIAPYRSASPKQFTSELTKAATQMEQLAAKAATSHKALTGTTSAVSRSIDALKAAADSLTLEVPKLGVAADRIEQTLRDGRTAADKAGAANADAARGIADRVKTAGDTVEASLKSLITAQQSLVTKSESVAAATERASQALVASTGRTGDAVDGMREATERWDAAAAHWQDAAARIDARIGALAGAPSPPLGGGETNGHGWSGAPGGGGSAGGGGPSSGDPGIGGHMSGPGQHADPGGAGAVGHSASEGYGGDSGPGSRSGQYADPGGAAAPDNGGTRWSGDPTSGHAGTVGHSASGGSDGDSGPGSRSGQYADPGGADAPDNSGTRWSGDPTSGHAGTVGHSTSGGYGGDAGAVGHSGSGGSDRDAGSVGHSASGDYGGHRGSGAGPGSSSDGEVRDAVPWSGTNGGSGPQLPSPTRPLDPPARPQRPPTSGGGDA